jgi:hypothetical protein
MRRFALLLLWPVAFALFIACTTDYQKGLEDPRYGAPNAFDGRRQPGTTSETVSDGGGAAGSPGCVQNGGTLVDAGTCAISFKNNILAAFKQANCQMIGACHGGASPASSPRINPDDPTGTWTEFTTFKLSNSNGKPYINPCSVSAADSTMACNVNTAATCGTLMPPGAGLPANIVADIETWLKCGSPNN